MRPRVLEQLVKNEAGIALPLAVIMVVLIGVMGAGLLTFVTTDLTNVVSVNQGQRAFEMADAGVQAAKRQLNFNSKTSDYDGSGSVDTSDESQWSWKTNGFKNGVTLNNLDGSSATDDSVMVTIQNCAATGATCNLPSGSNASKFFKATSTGRYGDAKRRVEAKFLVSSPSGKNGLPAWYSPGGMYLKKEALLDGMSFFSGKNIVLKKDKGDSLGDGTDQLLGNWDKPPYNTAARSTDKTGLAAEGIICDENKCNSSIADGIRSFDSTTGPGSGKGSEKKFVAKTPTTKTPQDAGTITYPFPRTPDVSSLLNIAKSGPPNVYGNSESDITENGAPGRVVFIDAGCKTIDFPKNATFNGTLVIRGGYLDIAKQATFNGILIVLKGDCVGKDEKNMGRIYFDKEATMNAYVYAESTDDEAIYMKQDPTIGPPPEEYRQYLDRAFPSQKVVTMKNWRELYQ